ncbi:penicillin-binding protein 2 [Aliarcobacter thereius]|uniref:Penicillin-binding protein 2 n=2 Tax=Aliarcobacter thereius TaxID=544718 RepID=A0A1C0B454_9BACT|nr:penicillin-binding protein 2 [Aliarcobacter thereius]OCL90086.1 Stage V sporulation protein D [Aliarcobacter thereius]OCL96314.1 Stage V sporulation protein D [Aliarcobacter thereius LMG 24486]OCL97098.1 Stage V sporulation protein D [Aliarcobacter thereius]QBF15723.1 penicillin-binding protein 2 [Aliarcobacter thereius LMG 24486]TLS71419.1 penicillin-binding protein 2 [Aliarcobacter thereius]
MKTRLNIIFIIIIVFALILVTRIYFLSIKSNTYYEELSKNNYIKKTFKAPIRGIIEDRNNTPIALNLIGFSINIKPHLSSSSNRIKLDSILDDIIKYLPEYNKDILREEYLKNDSPYNHEFIKLIDFISYEEMLSKFTYLQSNEDIQVELSSKRHYPFNELATHIIGYVGKATKKEIENNEVARFNKITGKSGIEKYYNEKLQGTLGYKEVKVNAYNKELEIIDEKEASTDNKVKITIDIQLQKFLQEQFKDKSGSVIIMDSTNGEILAASSFPEYNSNIFVKGISQKEWDVLRNDFNHPFTNKITNGLYPPGSVIKMGVAMSFLENAIPENFNVTCTGRLEIGNRNFRCWKLSGHGHIDFKNSIVKSCDDFYYKGSLKVGIDKISQTLDKFGFGQKTGIDLDNEFIGINPNKEWKERRFNEPWYIGETVITSIGQGNMLTTPLQIARFTAYFANGKLPKPHLNKEAYEEPIELDFKKEHLDLMRESMYDVVNSSSGTARRYIKSKVKIAAKTGTAQVYTIPQDEKVRMKESELEYYQRSHAWITTFGPYKKPKYVVTVIVEHGESGGRATGGIVSNIYDKLYELGYITELE